MGPLSGVRVVELAHIMSGPTCGMLLADAVRYTLASVVVLGGGVAEIGEPLMRPVRAAASIESQRSMIAASFVCGFGPG